MVRKRGHHHRRETHLPHFGRIYFLVVFFLLGAVVILAQLFRIQILQHRDYVVKAAEQHNIVRILHPKRGEIYWQDLSSDQTVSLVINKPVYNLYVVPKYITDQEPAIEILSNLLELDKDSLSALINQPEDPYEVLAYYMEPEFRATVASSLRETGFPEDVYGFEEDLERYYVFGNLTGHVTGFLGFAAEGNARTGQYGIEEYFNQQMIGEEGLILGDQDVHGRPIPVGNRLVKQALDGSDVILTIDKNIQYKACKVLRKYVTKYRATGGSVIIMNPGDGSIYAICGLPDFDPNDYSQEKISHFINPAVSQAYEPGSIFKPITMVAALDSGVLTPTTTYLDTGKVVIGQYTIHNSDFKAHGLSTMIDVLDKSLNTGAIFTFRSIGITAFRKYVNAFGFGKLTGIELAGEVDGDVSPLLINNEIYSATGSYGQGITVTPIQLVTAFAAIARGGTLVKPMIVKMLRNGTEEIRTEVKEADEVISREAAETLSEMLVSVVQNGYGKKAGVPGYRIAGKTGTAQIPKKDAKGYGDETIHSFIGFGPVGDEVPLFVMLVKLDRPKDIIFSSDSAAPLFGELARYLLDYFEVPPQESIGI